MLTKKSNANARRAWLKENTYISMRSKKRTDDALRKHVPSRPRMKVDKSLARRVLQVKDNAARAAGYDVPTMTLASTTAKSVRHVTTTPTTSTRRRTTTTGPDVATSTTGRD